MLDDRTKALVKRIRSEANIADRPGSYDRLQGIADDLKKLEPAIRKDQMERDRDDHDGDPSVGWHLEYQEDGIRRLLKEKAGLRAKVAALHSPPDGLWDVVRRADVLALFDGGE